MYTEFRKGIIEPVYKSPLKHPILFKKISIFLHFKILGSRFREIDGLVDLPFMQHVLLLLLEIMNIMDFIYLER